MKDADRKPLRKTIIYIGTVLLPDKSASAQRCLSICKTFRDLGYEVVIVGADASIDSKTDILLTKSTCEGFATFCVPRPQGTRQWIHHTVSAKEYISVIDSIGADSIASVVVMEYEAIPLLKLCRYCKKMGIPLVADSVEWFEKSSSRFPKNLVKDIDTALRMRFVYPRFVKNMICISRFLYEHYERKISNVVYIPGTIDATEVKWNLPEYHANDVLTLGYAGDPGMHFEKERLDYLVRAVSELNNQGKACRLFLAGIKEETLRKQMGAIYDSSRGIYCMGKVSHKECLSMIGSCDFSIIVREPTRKSNAGFPTKLSESFGCGTPVLTTRTSNISDYLPNEKWGVVCAGYDVQAIRRMIENAMTYNKEDFAEIHRMIKRDNPLKYINFCNDLQAFLDCLK